MPKSLYGCCHPPARNNVSPFFISLSRIHSLISFSCKGTAKLEQTASLAWVSIDPIQCQSCAPQDTETWQHRRGAQDSVSERQDPACGCKGDAYKDTMIVGEFSRVSRMRSRRSERTWSSRALHLRMQSPKGWSFQGAGMSVLWRLWISGVGL